MSDESYSPLEVYRNSIIDRLETDFPRDTRMITSEDITNVSIANACLAIHDKISGDPAEIIATKATLEMERDKIVEKIIDNVIPRAFLDAVRFPNENYRIGGVEQYSSVLDTISYLDERAHMDESSDYLDDTHYQYIFDQLEHKVEQGQTLSKSEKLVALKLTIEITRFGAWKDIAKKSISILEKGADVGKVEQLLQSIHQSDYEVSDIREADKRPIMDGLADRPWEVANTLSFVFAGYPWLSKNTIKPAIARLVKPYRMAPLVRNYFHETTIDSQRLQDAAQKSTFLQASLSLAKELPVSSIEHLEFFIDPYKAESIIYGNNN